jgi:ABC-type uncharacterized transport system substrate-binding protein
MMRRRDFITLLGGAAAAWPLAARSPVIGFLRSSWPEDSAPVIAAFRQGLSETGFIEGSNVAIDYRFARDQDDQLPVLATELVRRQVAAIFASPHPSALAVKAATATTPVVFVTGTDPVGLGLVASFNRPGGNVTGVYQLSSALASKRLDLLHQLVPKATRIAVLMNPNRDSSEQQTKEIQAAADALGLQVFLLNAASEPEFDAAFAMIARQQADALIIGADAFFNSRRAKLVALAARYRLPAIFDPREAVEAGGLMSYGISFVDAHRQAGAYVGRILRGDKPADLPVVQPTKFELTINLKTAKALGLTVPDTLLALADRVIE